MQKLTEVQTIVYKYDTMVEMMDHIKVMGDAGWSIVHSSYMLQTEYKKTLP